MIKGIHMGLSTMILFWVFLASCGEGNDPAPVEELPRISISSVTAFEGDENSDFRFQVTMNKPWDQEVRVNFATEEITAGDGTDYIGNSGTLSFSAGERSGVILVEVIGDTIKEEDEQFSVILSSPFNATLQVEQGIGTIRNDDSFVFVPEGGYITPEEYPGFTLVWRDEFEGTELDQANWTHEIGASGWGNNERQYYTDREGNSRLSDGNLVIEAKEESFEGAPYTSARIITRDKQEFAFGRIDIRAILPEGQGIWPALWMLGANHSEIGWPACGEIDIMELVGHEPSTVHGTAHWGEQGQGFSYMKGDSYSITNGKFSGKYHVFSLVWEPGLVKWYVDDNEYHRLTPADVNGSYPFDAAFFFIFNIAVGGDWPGYPDATTQFPQRMFVDYIRVFQKN